MHLRGINGLFGLALCRLLEDLEEVQTDKVSMEYLLREKLERLVQSEIEARVARMHQVCVEVYDYTPQVADR